MVKCPDCEEKDKIVIAGKVFCANCGTPWQHSSSVASDEVVGSKQTTPPVSGTVQKPPTPQPTRPPTDKVTPIRIKDVAVPATSNTPQSPPQPPKAVPAIPKKIDNINDQLESLKKASMGSVRPVHKNEIIVKEISDKIASQPIHEPTSLDGGATIQPIIPHSPIGDIEAGEFEVAVKSDSTVAAVNAKNPMMIDDKVLAENTAIVQASPIPSERIQAVVNEVIAAGRPVKKLPPQKVLSDQLPGVAKDSSGQGNQTATSVVGVKSQEQRLTSAATVAKSAAVNRFAAVSQTPAVDTPRPKPSHTFSATIAPPPPPPQKTPKVISRSAATELSQSSQKAQTFSDLAQVVPIKQPGPIDVAVEAQPSKDQATAPPAASQATLTRSQTQDAKEALDQLTAVVGSTASTNEQASHVDAPSPAIIKQAAMAMPSQSTTTDESEHIGSELVSLDSKDESILSDDEFSALSAVKSNAANQSANVDSISQTPQVSDASQSATPRAAVTTPPSTVSAQAKPKAVKPLDNLSAGTAAASTKQDKPTTTQQANTVFRQNTATALPPSPDGITPGVAFRPARAIDYPVTAPKPATVATDDKPLTEEEALKLVHQHAAKEANLPKPKVGHSFSASSLALSAFGLILVGAYIWQINYPNLAFKVAASKAGISASSPGYIPSGWKLSNNIKTSPGTVSYGLQSDGNKRQVAITEVKTDWDSQALAENYITGQSPNYLALQAQGLTIYMYGDNQASWVNRGNWYRIEGQSHGLSQDQIIKIATSL